VLLVSACIGIAARILAFNRPGLQTSEIVLTLGFWLRRCRTDACPFRA
jgi:hypothetical protein